MPSSEGFSLYIFTMVRSTKTRKEGTHLVQRGDKVKDPDEKQIKIPFPIACINWPRGCNYKTPRGVPTEEQVLQVLELHKRVCNKRAIDNLPSKASDSKSHGFLKPSPSEVCVEESFSGGEKRDPGGDGEVQGAKSDQTSFQTENELIKLEMGLKETHRRPDAAKKSLESNASLDAKEYKSYSNEFRWKSPNQKSSEHWKEPHVSDRLVNLAKVTEESRHIEVEESSLGEMEDLEPNLLNKTNLRYKLMMKAKYIEDLKLEIGQSGKLGWSLGRRQLEEVNLQLLQGQLNQWVATLQLNPSIMSGSMLSLAGGEDRDTFDHPVGEGLVVPDESVESNAKRRDTEEKGNSDNFDIKEENIKEETKSTWKQERINELEPIFCLRCEFSCVEAEEFTKHTALHRKNKSLPCLQCGKHFTQVGNLKTHMLLHSGETNFICSYCEKTFAQKGSLKRHLISHTGAKPFKCNQCDSSYCQPPDLRYHVLTQHTGEKSNLKRHTCEKCESSFIRASERKRHMLIHSGERPFRCEVCGYTCGRINQLKTHILIHSDTKPFLCKKCNYSSTQASNLKRHMNMHAETPFLSC